MPRHCCYLPLHPEAEAPEVKDHRTRRLGDTLVIYCSSLEDAQQVSRRFPGSTVGEYTHLGILRTSGEY
jgi:hypothetical protein